MNIAEIIAELTEEIEAHRRRCDSAGMRLKMAHRTAVQKHDDELELEYHAGQVQGLSYAIDVLS